MNTKAFGLVHEYVFRNKSLSEPRPSIVGTVWVYTDKTTMTLEATAAVVNEIHLVLLYFLKEFRRYYIHHSYTLRALFLVCILYFLNSMKEASLKLEKYLDPSSVFPLTDFQCPRHSKRKYVNQYVLHYAMH